jgi:hypothetical protein
LVRGVAGLVSAARSRSNASLVQDRADFQHQQFRHGV